MFHPTNKQQNRFTIIFIVRLSSAIFVPQDIFSADCEFIIISLTFRLVIFEDHLLICITKFAAS